jgi:hypothetical protein
LEESINIVDRRDFVYHKPDVSSYDHSLLTEAELELLFKETPADHCLFGGISQAWAVNQLEDASSNEDYRRHRRLNERQERISCLEVTLF